MNRKKTNWDQQLRSQNLQEYPESVRNTPRPRCRGRRRNIRCRKWIEECAKACTTGEDRDRNKDRDQDGDRDLDDDDDGDEDGDGDADEIGDGDGDGDADGDGDGEGDSSTWQIQCSSQPSQCCTGSSYLSSETRRTRHPEAFGLHWPHPLELALDLSAGLALLSLLGEGGSEMMLPPLFLFILYLLLTMPLAMVLGCRKRNRRLTWREG
ncbi:uncharacterized protein LOC141546453 isoform X2 [Sminthopsis crassicaudata]|uniref:uncharacterized protein LOC141546453 isoform X2 n=1 Tax=Sminthopsis crassicaudata TaxID=9301 RepID=UPI003D69E0EA